MAITSISNKRILLLSLFLFYSSSTFATTSNGFVTVNNYAFFILENTIYKLDITTNKTIKIHDINTNKKLTNQLDSILDKDLIQTNKKYKNSLKPICQNIKAINLSINSNHLLVTFKFQTTQIESTKSRYATLELDTNFIFVNLYYFKHILPYKAFSVFPFYSMEFDKKGNVFLPLYHQNIIQIAKYKLIAKNNKFVVDSLTNHKISASKWKVVDYEFGDVIHPVIYPISHSKFKYYFIHPFPVIFGPNNKIIDVYNQKKTIDSLNNLDNNEIQFSYPNISIEKNLQLTRNIILTSEYRNDSILLICTNTNTDSIDIIQISNKSGVIASKTIYSPFANSNYYLNNNSLYILNYVEMKVKKVQLYQDF